jgi:putative ABC transport system permease protein
MKFLRLIYRNLFHSRRRTILTVASITVALFLFATLRSIITAFDASVKVADAARLITRSSIAIVFPLPISYKEKIAQVPGVEMVTWGNWFGGQYKNEPYAFAQFAVDKDNYFKMYSELVVPPDQMAAFQAERTACIVGEGLAKFTAGDVIPIARSTRQWSSRRVSQARQARWTATSMYFRFDYPDQDGRGWTRGSTSKLASARRPPLEWPSTRSSPTALTKRARKRRRRSRWASSRCSAISRSWSASSARRSSSPSCW